MSTLIVSAIVIGIVLAICMLLVSIDKNQRRKKINGLLYTLSQAGSKNNLRFSAQEILNDCVIGLDGINRKLFILHGIDTSRFSDCIIDLDEVKTCSLEKIFEAADGGTSNSRRGEQNLSEIVLNFRFNNNKAPVKISFYKHIVDHIYLLSGLEHKAKDWETVLNKMLRNSLHQSA